jgi:hypothetical protein
LRAQINRLAEDSCRPTGRMAKSPMKEQALGWE